MWKSNKSNPEIPQYQENTMVISTGKIEDLRCCSDSLNIPKSDKVTQATCKESSVKV